MKYFNILLTGSAEYYPDFFDMELRTTFIIESSLNKITYYDPVVFIGSCFANEIGKQFESAKMPVMINPSGTVYNPVSVLNTLEMITSGKRYTSEDIYSYNGTWLSFDHYSDFSSEDPDAVVDRINSANDNARKFFSSAKFLFLTFGTARVYRRKASGQIVSNCHKIPASEFSNELLDPQEIVSLWDRELAKLKSLYPTLKVVFTISPVRHWKDGAHGNQVSKSVLFVAVEKLLGHPSEPGYFPAYELLMDDLRDYRFYDDDMLHPSRSAINYVWQKFSGCYFDRQTVELGNEVMNIVKALNHRLTDTSEKKKKEFALSMLERIRRTESKLPMINFSAEKSWFAGMCGDV